MMRAEGTPHPETSLLATPMQWLTALACRYPLRTLIFAGVLAMVSVGLAARCLRLQTSRADLISPQSEYHRHWLDYTKEFGDQEDVVVVVEGSGPEAVSPVAAKIAEAVARQGQFFKAVLHEVDLSRLRSKGLYYLTVDQLQSIEQSLDEAAAALEERRGRAAALGAAGAVRLPPPVPSAGALSGGLSGGAVPPSGPGDSAALLPGAFTDVDVALPVDGPLARAMLTRNGRMAFVLLRFAKDKEEQFARNSDAIDALRRILAHVKERHPEVKIGLTGLPVIENDEMRASESSSSRASVFAMVGVIFVFVVGFGGLRHPLLANAALFCGMLWSLGFTTLAVGRLNILSIAFAAILIGQGADFGIYYIARYLQLRKATALPAAEALIETGRTAGPSIADGALGTAAAFFMAGLTDFMGVAELGVIAGGGLILCWLSTMIVLPAMVRLVDGNRFCRRLPEPLDLFQWFRPLYARPRLTLAATVAVTLVLTLGMSRLWYDHNLFNLQPAGLEGIELERKLVAESDQAVYYALSVADSREEVQARKERFLALQSVDRVEEIASALPSDEEAKRPLIARIHRRVTGLGARLDAAGAARGAGATPAPDQNGAAVLAGRLAALGEVCNPEPPRLEDLPPGLTARFVGQNGRHLMKVYSKADIWDLEGMGRFVAEVRSVDKRATGNPLQIYEASHQMKQSYQQAAFYALLVIVPVLLFDFRNILHTLLAVLPLGLGMAQLFGLLGLLNIPLNPANMIVLPIILGIGIDNGVHIVHDFLQQGDRYRRMSSSTCMAIVINSLCNMVGFGSLMIASHQGLQSLGRVLTIGMACILANSLVLPNLLVLYQRRRAAAAELPPDEPPATLAAVPDVSEEIESVPRAA